MIVGVLEQGVGDGSIRADLGNRIVAATAQWGFMQGVIQVASTNARLIELSGMSSRALLLQTLRMSTRALVRQTLKRLPRGNGGRRYARLPRFSGQPKPGGGSAFL